MGTIIYKYVGGGFYPGIPSRDLDKDDVGELGAADIAAVETGILYKKVEPATPTAKVKKVKNG